jgi:hypothetical protein
MLYCKYKKETTAHKVVDLMKMVEKPPLHLAKVLGWFFYVVLLTKHKNECKQCQKERAKSQHILQIKIILIFHSITPIPSRMKVNTPCNTVVSYAECIITFRLHQ